MTSKQRAYLRGMANGIDPIFQIGKGGVTPDVTKAINDAWNTRELLKITVLKTCSQAPYDIADVVAQRTHSEVVQVIGRKIVLYKRDKDNPKIELPG